MNLLHSFQKIEFSFESDNISEKQLPYLLIVFQKYSKIKKQKIKMLFIE